MRKTPSSNAGEKLYQPEGHLSVCGRKITYHQPSFYGRKLVKIELSSVNDDDYEERAVVRNRSATRVTADNKNSRTNLAPKIAKWCNVSAVCSREVKRIRESVQIDDFERILRDFHVVDVHRSEKQKKLVEDVIFEDLNPSDIHEEFFLRHETRLTHVIANGLT